MKRFTALLLDFGGVCLRLPFELHPQVEETLGLPPGSFTWLGPVRLETDPLWRAILEGNLTERAYWKERAEEVGKAAGRELTVADYMRVCCDRPEEEFIRPEAVAVVRAMRAAGIRVGILTNDLSAFLGPTWKEGIRFFREIDSYTDVSDGVMKPDPRAYAEALAALGEKPENVLFVDDQPANVEGARNAGIEAMHFEVGRPAESWEAVRRRILGN